METDEVIDVALLPAFEVHHKTHVFRVWQDGHIEGFPAPAWIVNRIPLLHSRELSALAQLVGAIDSFNAAQPPSHGQPGHEAMMRHYDTALAQARAALK